MSDIATFLVMLLALVAIVIIAKRCPFSRVTVYEYERGLKYVKGRFVSVLSPGAYWFSKSRTSIVKVDVRPSAITIPGQEVISSDGIVLRVSLAAVYEVADPNVAVNKVQNYHESLYLAAQVALREVIGSASIEELLEKRDELGKQILDLVVPKAEALGLGLQSLNIKDIMLPGDLKRIFAQVVKARKEGVAALERARGETAALRNLANAAKMMESNPALMNLRVLQSMGDSSGNTFVVGLPAGAVPVPARSAGSATVEETGEDEATDS